ncbi:transketolase C-terminal domain-containing protein [Streptomyces sp. SP17BM10]|uniref:alpha-ketoacid dehydrogenase subunit beta n=1 Tax=Streptomyces sp. SP17BM10 TaxID=3002530 RepID=UPI002E7A7F89|nr:transketolase C-terminal domain-containing protein [Streptomyces sp. SP17BM10]MEE1784665.1 transketolase C-terminal domain-containing protein [Streptomyces sp. SP17BM10]
MSERVAENLNHALHTVFAAHQDTYLLGEDVHDPYGGAFKITRGLTDAYPDRVLTTPISEGALLGVAGGLALAGRKAIAEIMFSDFVALGFDQILNFASKSTTMFGSRVPMRLIVRCPTGGGRGYGPTHSQSLQKHFIGIPGLSVYELSPFRDNAELLTEAFDRGEPCMLFEDKVLYTQRMYADGVVDDIFRYETLGGSTAHVYYADEPQAADCVLILPGGITHRALAAARELLLEDEIVCRLLVPSRLHPVDLDPLLPVVRGRQVFVVEESTAGGTWGAEIAHRLHECLWGELAGPVRLVHSADSVVPTASHLERQVLVQAETIRDTVRGSLADD